MDKKKKNRAERHKEIKSLVRIARQGIWTMYCYERESENFMHELA